MLAALAPSEKSIIVDALELEAQRKCLNRQCAILSRHHSPESIILIRVLAEYHAYTVRQAKQGFLLIAQSQLSSLDSIPLPDDNELHAVYETSALPAWALIRWLENKNETAIQHLRAAICACFDLTTKFSHDYLTVKRIHLAANIARVLISSDFHTQGLEYVAALRAVVSGDRSCWPFEGSNPLTCHWRAQNV